MKSFFNNLKSFSSFPAFSTKSELLTYNDLLNEIEDFPLIIGNRTLVFILCENSIESIIGYLTCLRKGHIPLLIGSSINEELLLNLIKIYNPTFIWTNLDYKWFDGNWQNVFQNRRYQLWMKKNNLNYSFHPDLAILLMTSGSTGSPVLVRVSYQNLIENTNSISQSLGISQIDIPITTLPMNYTYGLSIINSHLLNGCKIILTEESIVSKNFWDLINSKGVTTFGGVPYTYQMLRRLGFEKMSLPTITKLTQAGGKLDSNLAKYFADVCKQKEIEFYVMYGQTEATARMSCLPSNDSIRKSGSIGLPISKGSFYLLSDVGKVITKSQEVGELYYKGPNVSMGYAYSVADFSKNDENHGVLATGDLAMRDEEGYYYIVGRKKRFVKIFGNRVSLDEVEGLTLKNGYSCVCTGFDDKLFIFTTQQESLNELKDFVSIKTGLHHSAITVKFITEFPRNDSGKILYTELKVD